MSEMVKRVQSAIQQVLVDHGVDSEKLARAAIAAMREPTEAMVNAARTVDPAVINDEYADALTHWRAMIDSALK